MSERYTIKYRYDEGVAVVGNVPRAELGTDLLRFFSRPLSLGESILIIPTRAEPLWDRETDAEKDEVTRNDVQTRMIQRADFCSMAMLIGVHPMVAGRVFDRSMREGER